MNRTKIDWATASWNPVTGCLHGCEYCYARAIAHRFTLSCGSNGTNHILDEPYMTDNSPGDDFDEPQYVKDPYPYEFDPTFHRYHLDKPQHFKKPQNIFTVSMGDMFGDWVPDEWIRAVFDACEAAPWHNYLFLTKNWMRACEYRYKDNWWAGRTITHAEPCGSSNKNLYLCYGVPKSIEPIWRDHPNRFISIEPIQSAIPDLRYYAHEYGYKWVIVGAETGNRKSKVIPRREWVAEIVDQCKSAGVPVFLKSSLAGIWGKPLIQEYPPQLLAASTDMKGC